MKLSGILNENLPAFLSGIKFAVCLSRKLFVSENPVLYRSIKYLFVTIVLFIHLITSFMLNLRASLVAVNIPVRTSIDTVI